MAIDWTGRVFGKAPDGMILVKLTVEEYLASLKDVGPADVLPFVSPVSPDQRPLGQASQAQRAFNGQKPPRVRNAGVPRIRVECRICGKPFDQARSNQRLCLDPECRRLNHLDEVRRAYQKKQAMNQPLQPVEPIKAPAAAPAAPPAAPAGSAPVLTRLQKQQRLEAIRAAKARVYGQEPIERRGSFDPDVPREFTQAQREAHFDE